ncbi:MAG: hypothetical protein KDA61_21860 [Planctomycetales bacterium]|nr:hypothetical protein [Planctomycetales bacterium]
MSIACFYSYCRHSYRAFASVAYGLVVALTATSNAFAVAYSYTASANSSDGSVFSSDEVALDEGSADAAPLVDDTFDAQNAIDVSDSAVRPVQMLAPQRTLASQPQFSRDDARLASNTRRASGSRTPYMIGDTGAGTCFAFGGLFDAEMSHPAVGCSRLNISENNSALPTDRLYLSYRHFHNASRLRAWQFAETYNYDRFMLGGEKTFWDGNMSFEMRLPIENRVNSQLETYIVDDPRFDLDPIDYPSGFFPFLGGTQTEIGNISFLLKALMYESREFAMSMGLGVTMPTASDMEYLVTTDHTLEFPSEPGLTADSSVLLDVFASNETFYLAPFWGWLWQPNDRFFHQGFLQVEVAANPTSVTVNGDGIQDFYQNGVFVSQGDWETATFPTTRSDVNFQTLMRLNLGVGYHLVDNPGKRGLNRLTALAEVHWTSTLNDAAITNIPTVDTFGTSVLQQIDFGNPLNRVDIVNLVTGVTARVNNWVVTNGFAVPLSRELDKRGFDFEYNLQLQRIF